MSVEFLVSRYAPAVFYPCPDHRGAEAVVVIRRAESTVDVSEPLCAECGRDLSGVWVDPDPVLEERWRRTWHQALS